MWKFLYFVFMGKWPCNHKWNKKGEGDLVYHGKPYGIYSCWECLLCGKMKTHKNA